MTFARFTALLTKCFDKLHSLMLHISTKDIQIVRRLKASKGKMRQEAELASAKASIPKQDVTGVCIYCDAGCSS